VWAALEKLVGARERIEEIAADLVKHFEARDFIEGKAMIVGMSREICARLYEEIVKLRPAWHDADIEKGANQSDHDGERGGCSFVASAFDDEAAEEAFGEAI
jgi:type I site-specific restriction-modification system R (restriction) subunit